MTLSVIFSSFLDFLPNDTPEKLCAGNPLDHERDLGGRRKETGVGLKRHS